MSKVVGMVLVKPTVFMQDSSVEIKADQLGVATKHISLSPIRLNLLTDEMELKIKQFKQKVFEDIAETAITIEWKNGLDIGFEDDIALFGFPKKRETLEAVSFSDYLFLMTEEMMPGFKARFSLYEEQFNEIIIEIADSYDDMINSSFVNIFKVFPSVKAVESDLRNGLLDRDTFRNFSKISCGIIDVGLKVSGVILQSCLREAKLTAYTIATRLIADHDNNNIVNKFKTVEKAIQRMEKYNVVKDSSINELIENFKKLLSLYNQTEVKEYDQYKLLEELLHESNNMLIGGQQAMI
ncbi:hypothetical protein DZB84_04610 [Bacillus sp. HNG]|uniref:hypothetical protein n=1 Tax=Bacillus sp. HNG TaxID=2293325 RepID=UPI000E2E8739|nr:hypothetical protein [Bacillus sp. HNG]RFB18202.1 hypothetical protein DZB84_04610 [Bacillus sp. HNG]